MNTSVDHRPENTISAVDPIFPEHYSISLRKDLGKVLDRLSKDASVAMDLNALSLGAKARTGLAAPISSENSSSLLLYLRESNRALLGLSSGWANSKGHLRAEQLIEAGYAFAEGPKRIDVSSKPSDSKDSETIVKPSVDSKEYRQDDVPDIVKNRYLRNPNNAANYYYRDRDNKLAFSDNGKQLTTPNNDPIVADSMVAMAIARNWGSIKISGADEFKKEVWMQAQLAGMLTIGYKPTDVDFARLDSAKQKQAEQARKDLEKLAKASPINGVPGAKKVSDSGRSLNETSVGEKLLDSGFAPYDFDPRDGIKKSFYVKTETQDGKERIYWGVGLKEALDNSGAKINDLIVPVKKGREAINANQSTRDGSGNLLEHEPVSTARNAWEIKVINPDGPRQEIDNTSSAIVSASKSSQDTPLTISGLWAQKAKAFLNGDPKLVLGAYPELGKTLLAYKAAQSYFEQTVPEDGKRNSILDEIKQGLYARILAGNVPQVKIIDERKIGVLVDHGKSKDNSYFVSYKDLFGKVQTLKDPRLEMAMANSKLAIGQPIEMSMSVNDRNIKERLDQKELPVEPKGSWIIKGGNIAIYSQAITFGAIAKAKGANAKTIDLVITAALIKGHQLTSQGFVVPMPNIFDAKAPSKPMATITEPEKSRVKNPKIDRNQSIGR